MCRLRRCLPQTQPRAGRKLALAIGLRSLNGAMHYFDAASFVETDRRPPDTPR